MSWILVLCRKKTQTNPNQPIREGVCWNRLAAGLVSGKVVIWDILAGRELAILYNHQVSISLLKSIYFPGQCTKLVSIDTDGLITIWDLESREMLKCFMLSQDISVRLMLHIPCLEFPDVITLLFGHSKLQLFQMSSHQLQEPFSTQDIGRTNAKNDVVKLLESSEHVVCISGHAVDIYEKQWDTNGRLTLQHVDILARPDEKSLFCSATRLSEDKFAVGTLSGEVLVCKINHRMEPTEYPAFHSDSPVNCLLKLHGDLLLVVYEKSLHVVSLLSRKCEYAQTFSSSLGLVYYVPASHLLITQNKGSCKLLTWDVKVLEEEGRNRSNESLCTLHCEGALLAHTSTVRGVELCCHGLITYSDDFLVIIWTNKDEEVIRLINAINQTSTIS
ncbi:uncharacterized protein [Watersipora subatra]|uniref:uncharacterized protein n=1 Tax=Watersipora subatra TaxID=2589382 RepID=UPI00355B7B47